MAAMLTELLGSNFLSSGAHFVGRTILFVVRS